MTSQDSRLHLENLLSNFVDVAILFGQNYLSCGGPTSRLEKRLIQAANALDLECEIFAIPTGIFVTVSHPDYPVPITKNARVKEISYNLYSLYRLEKLLASMVNKKIRLPHAKRYLTERHDFKVDYPKWLIQSSPFIFGAFVTLPLVENPLHALIGGIVTLLIASLRKLILARTRLNQTFADFFASWMAFFGASLLGAAFRITPDILVFGTLIMMVPGLTLTTSVSELAEHNYVSGLTKMVQGGLTILSMGLAYLLFQEVYTAIGAAQYAISGLNLGTGWSSSVLINMACLVFAVTSFAVILNVPPKSLPLVSAIGLTGLMVIKIFHESSFYVAGIFAASFTVGVLSLFFGRLLKLPSQVYSVPGIVSLVPGLMSLTLFNHVAFQALDKVPSVIMQVVITASSIVFGLLAARVPFNLLSPSDDERMAELEEGVWSEDIHSPN